EYANHYSSLGVLVNDVYLLNFTNGIQLRVRMTLGCGYDHLFQEHSYHPLDGMLGLGRGRSSLVSQLNSQGLLNKELAWKPLKEAHDDHTLPQCWHGRRPFRSIHKVRKYFKPMALSFAGGGRSKAQFEIPPEAHLIISNMGNVCLGILNGSEDLNLIGGEVIGSLVVITDSGVHMEHAPDNGGSNGGFDSGTREVRPPDLEVDDKMEERVFFDEMIEESDDTEEEFQGMYQDEIEQEAVNSEDLGEQEFQAMFDGNDFSHGVDELYRIEDIENIAMVDFLNIGHNKKSCPLAKDIQQQTNATSYGINRNHVEEGLDADAEMEFWASDLEEDYEEQEFWAGDFDASADMELSKEFSM
ncbi:hypothetical protein HN51_059566, partial [Arachis hypogaea]